MSHGYNNPYHQGNNPPHSYQNQTNYQSYSSGTGYTKQSSYTAHYSEKTNYGYSEQSVSYQDNHPSYYSRAEPIGQQSSYNYPSSTDTYGLSTKQDYYSTPSSTQYGGINPSSYGGAGISSNSYGGIGINPSSYGGTGISPSSYGTSYGTQYGSTTNYSTPSSTQYGGTGISPSSYGGAGISSNSYGGTGISSNSYGTSYGTNYGSTTQDQYSNPGSYQPTSSNQNYDIKSNIQNFAKTNLQNFAQSALQKIGKHIPLNLQRSNFVSNFTYQDEPSAPGASGPARVSTIQTNFANNPYYYHFDHKPCIEQEIKPSAEDEEDDSQNRERLRKKVFAFFSQAETEFMEFTKLVSRLEMTGEKYTDKDFPPNIASLIGRNENRRAEWHSVDWLRPDDFYGPGTYKIFMDRIEPNDIKQGQLGDCYFLSTISSLAEWPERIRKLFALKQPNTCGCYCIKVCEMGEWKEVVVDDYFPCDKYQRTPIFTRGHDQELWVLLLEKVWAKIYGSYDAIEAGLARECLHDFTGAPTKFYLTDRKEEWEMIWGKLAKSEGKNYCMTCGAGDFFEKGMANIVSSKGIVSSHAYSLLSVHEIDTQYGRTRLVKLRNPWGKTEWKGKWSDSSYDWTPELKRRFNLESKDDGIFFMSYEDFLQHFTDIQICYVHDNYQYNYLRVNSDVKHAKYFKLRVDTPGHYYITVNQESKRKNAQNPHFKYSTTSLVIAKVVGNQQYEYVGGNNRADREVWAKGLFSPGEYIVYAKVPWNSGRNMDFVLSCYGPGKASIETISKQGLNEFLEKTFITKARLSQKKQSYAREGEPNCFSTVDITRDGFVFIYYQNNSNKTLETQVYFKEFRGIKLRKPYRGREYQIRVPPNQEKIVLLKMLPNQDVRQVLQEQVRFVGGY